MSKNKISFIIGTLGAGGAERVVTTLSNELVENYDVHIILLTKCEPFYKLNTRVKLYFCREAYKPSNNIFQALKGNYSLYKTISGYLKKEKINLAIGFMTGANNLAILASRKNNIPCIISQRIYSKKSSTKLSNRVIRNFLYRKASFLVVQTTEIKAEFESILESNKIVILKNPISPELSEARDVEFKKENIILNIGRLSSQKAQDVLIRAFANIENENWKLIIIGKGEKQKNYEALIDELNLKKKVELMGRSKDIAHYYNKSKIFAFTSIFEGFPNALTEAMHFGLPCISTDCPTGPSKLINNNHNGYLIPMGDQKQLEHCLSSLIQNKNLRDKFGSNARKSVQSYKADAVTLEWIGLFEKLLN
ncbi:glycosyltransferase family 4 protein [Algibacter mikhailovii]|uniref:Glycosyl transferase n=1 Tax=Algibacter mikhailovii TaxID=425498 RepID=A0A918QVI4_9FLAO|nr:glycosyltransferase family 4 protein [Algibacter mikhailovii]GGZ70385.1 glycosyl transferase [Algibacter mikhailovii]